jgi:hypothetical protein
MSAAPFSRRGLVAIVGVLSLSFLALLVWAIFGGEIKSTDSVQADAFSRSALGHHAFVELLRELGVDTLISRNNSGTKAGDRAVLLIAEPIISSGLRESALRELVENSGHCLLVLPKWEGVEDREREGWVRRVFPVDMKTTERPLRGLGCEASVTRLETTESLRWDAPIGPRLVRPQLLEPDDVIPVIACAEGVLLGVVSTRYGQLFVLSDPDLLSNHGLAHTENAVAMLHVLDRVRGAADRPVVVDETLHGFGREPSVYRALFDYPLVLTTLHGLAVLAVLLWAAMGRFGPPMPFKPPLGQGKEVLLGNTADLLAAGGHSGPALTRYLEFAILETRRILRAPARLTGDELDRWLDRIAASRGIEPTVPELRGSVAALAKRRGSPSTRDVLTTARTIHRWTEEMIRGRNRNS